MTRYYFVCLLAGLSFFTRTSLAKTGDSDLEKARYLYTRAAFHDAIPYYEKALRSQNDAQVYASLADCYRLTLQPQKAAEQYQKAVAAANPDPMLHLHYAQVLMNLQRYDEAVLQLNAYTMQNPNDRRAKNMLAGAQTAKAKLAAMPAGALKFAAFNTDANEFAVSLRGSELVYAADTVLFGRDKEDHRSGRSFVNLYAVQCNAAGDCNTKMLQPGSKMNSKFHDGPATFSADGRTAVFTRTNITRRFFADAVQSDAQEEVHLELMLAEGFDSSTRKFARIKDFPFNDKAYSNAQPALSPSGNTLVFVSDKAGGTGGPDLYWSKKDSAGNWSMPASLGNVINTEGAELFPVFQDERTLYFSSDGHEGLGGLDIYRVVWDDAHSAFSQPELMPVPFNSSFDDMSPVFYADASSGYMASNRPAAKGGDNIYYFSAQAIYLALQVTDDVSNAPLAGVSVRLQAASDNRDMTTPADGKLFSSLYPQSNYRVTISREGYEPQTMNLFASAAKMPDTISKTVRLVPMGGIAYRAIVMDRKAREPITDAQVVVRRLGNMPNSDTLNTGRSGSISTALKEGSDYQVFAVKEGMYSDERLIMGKDMRRGSKHIVNDTIFMSKLQVGAVIKIENIYYDYDKANIREDAKQSLQRLLEVMQANASMVIQINAHTDCRGSAAYNTNLSERRAQSVVRWLTENGISKERMRSKGFGASKPTADCECASCSEAQHQENRRTEFEILKM